MRLSLPLLLAASLASTALLAPASAQTIYKWKDANGVTRYSGQPPASGRYTSQEMARDPRPAATDATTAAADGAPASGTAPANSGPDSRCTTARTNLATLQSDKPVQIDSNNDGTPDKTLSDSERASEMTLARATLKAYNCSESAAPSADAPAAAN